MSIAALALDRYADSTSSVAVKRIISVWMRLPKALALT